MRGEFVTGLRRKEGVSNGFMLSHHDTAAAPRSFPVQGRCTFHCLGGLSGQRAAGSLKLAGNAHGPEWRAM